MKILEEILSYKKSFLEKQKKALPFRELARILDKNLSSSRFGQKLSGKGIRLIAEVKKASPSRGIIARDFDVVRMARAYQEGGASCLSVLTEDKFFQGDLFHLMAVRQVVALPILRKDFIIDEYQIYESKAFGADAVLLIAGILDSGTLKGFLKKAQELKLDIVLEVHSEDELKKALDAEVLIIGINTRDLADFSIDLKILPRLLAKIPQEKLIICESGIKTVDDLAYVKNFKVNAVLVGEALMAAANPILKTREFVDFLKGQ